MSRRTNERFQKIRMLGEGATSHVFEVEDRLGHGRFALKQLRTDSCTPERLARFKDEFRQFQHISHPNLAKNYELISDETGVYVLMELVEGVDFLEYVRSGSNQRAQPHKTQSDRLANSRTGTRVTTFGGELSLERLRAALRQLVSGLSALHAANKVHCDIKPENVLVTATGRVVIIDFGSATDAGRQAGEPRGTPDFMAPEQFAGLSSEAADWYAVGVLLYCALAGRLPIAGTTYSLEHAKRYNRPIDPRIRASGLPDDLVRLSLRLLEAEPSARPTARDIVRELGSGAAVVSVAPLRFVGRGGELRRLYGAMHASTSDARVVHVCGEAGIGKTALVSRFVTSLEGRGGVAFRGTCYSDARVRYRALDGLADRIAAWLARHPVGLEASERRALAALFPAFARPPRVAPETMEGSDPVLLRARAVCAFRELMVRVAERTPVVVWIDDFQWADEESIELLTEILEPPAPRGVLFIVSYRAGCDRQTQQFRSARLHLPCDYALALAPLSTSALRTLFAGAGSIEEDSLETLADECHGSPAFAADLLRARLSGEPSGSFDALLADRIERLEPQQRELLELIAIAMCPVHESVLQVALGVPSDVAQLARRVLLAASLIRLAADGDRALEPYHERIREHVVSSLRPQLVRERRSVLAAAFDAFLRQPVAQRENKF